MESAGSPVRFFPSLPGGTRDCVEVEGDGEARGEEHLLTLIVT